MRGRYRQRCRRGPGSKWPVPAPTAHKFPCAPRPFYRYDRAPVPVWLRTLPGWLAPALYSLSYALQTTSPAQLSLFPQKVAVRQRSGGGKVQNVVKCCKNHQHHDDRQPDAQPQFLRALRQGPSPQRLDSIEQKVTAVEHGNREQIEQADRYRQHRGQVNKGDEAGRGHLAGNLGDADRPAELVGRLAAGENPTDVRQRAVDQEPGFLRAGHDRFQRTHLAAVDVARRHRAADAEHAEPLHVAEIVLQLAQLRGGSQRHRRAATLDFDGERLAGADADDALHVAEAVDLAAVDRQHEVAGLKAGRRRRAVGLYGIDPGGGGLLADRHEDGGEDDDGEDEIGERSGHHHGRARGDFLAGKGQLALDLRHAGDRLRVRRARLVVVAEELHIAAERDGRELPAGAVTVVEAGELRPKTDRKGQYFDAAPARHQEVAKLMKKHNNRKNEEERDDIARQAPAKRAQAAHEVKMHTTL